MFCILLTDGMFYNHNQTHDGDVILKLFSIYFRVFTVHNPQLDPCLPNQPILLMPTGTIQALTVTTARPAIISNGLPNISTMAISQVTKTVMATITQTQITPTTGLSVTSGRQTGPTGDNINNNNQLNRLFKIIQARLILNYRLILRDQLILKAQLILKGYLIQTSLIKELLNTFSSAKIGPPIHSNNRNLFFSNFFFSAMLIMIMFDYIFEFLTSTQ